MGNEYSKQAQNNPSSPYRAWEYGPNQGTTCVGCNRNDIGCPTEEGPKEKLSKGRRIVPESVPKGAKQIGEYPDSKSHGQRPFINYHEEGNDGLRITAAFSLNYSAQYSSCIDSIRKVPLPSNPGELTLSSMQQDVVSQLLPGGFTNSKRKALWTYELPTLSACRSHTDPRVILQDREYTAYKNNLTFPIGICHETTCLNKNDFYVRSGSNNPASSSIPMSNSSVIWSLKKPMDTRKPVTDLLWSYQPHGRALGDTTIPTFPTLSYGDRAPCGGSKRSGGRPWEKAYVKNKNTPKHSKGIPGPGNVYQMSDDQRAKRSDSKDERMYPHKATECVRREEIIAQPYDCFAFEQLHQLKGSSDGHPFHTSVYTKGCLLSNELEGGIVRDMSCRGMPSSLSIGYPDDTRTVGQTKGAICSPTDATDWSRAQCFGFPQQPHPKEQTRSAKEFIHGPHPSSNCNQLPRVPPVSKAHSVHKSPRAAEMEPTSKGKSLQFPNFDSGSLHHRTVSCNHHWKPKDPQAQRSTSITRGPEVQTYGDWIKPMESPHKPDQFPESVADRLRTSHSQTDPLKVPLATVSSEARSESMGNWKTETKQTNRSTADIAAGTRISLKCQANAVTQGRASEQFTFRSADVPRRDNTEVKQEQFPSAYRPSASGESSQSSSVHSDCAIQKPKRKQRFDWDTFTLSLQRKSLVGALSNDEPTPTNNESLSISDEISPDKVGPDTPPAESSHNLTPETEGTDSTSNADSSCDAAGNAESDDADSVIIDQQHIDEGIGEANKSTTKKPTCDICGKTFTRNNTLISHRRIHSGARPYSCDQCGRAFRQQGNLTRHMLTHTSIKNYTCSYCNKKFSRASNLHTHLRIHTNYRPFKCDICHKGFYQKMDLKVHRYTHTGEKPHVCSKCGKGFKQVTHLKYHLRIHSDVRMFTCEYCGKGFNQKGNLKAHIYGHTGDRPHKCNICGKAFTLASTLNTHKRTHAPIKPFQCKFCSKAYYQKNALKTHYISAHPFTSGYCNM